LLACHGPSVFHPLKPLAKSRGVFKGFHMKSDIHPAYAPVVFRDLASGVSFLTKSTVGSSKTVEWEDGNTYPLIEVEISSESHPFYTGKQRIMDTAGRVERFNARFKGFGKK
jgi:large subunit ribosomal protein L31